MGLPSRILSLLFFCCSIYTYAAAREACTPCRQIIFKENKGQWNKNVLYKAEMHYANTYLERTGITYQLLDTADLKHFRSEHPMQITYQLHESKVVHGHTVRASFIGADTLAAHIGSDKTSDYYNYFIGRDRSHWANHVGSYRDVTYAGIYAGIDLHAYSEGSNLKYDWIIKAGSGAKPIPIRIKYDGADKVYLRDKKLVINTSVGTMMESEPYAYQELDSQRIQVACAYEMREDGTVSFSFPKGYDVARDLIIDPTLIFSTYSGSTADNFGYTATYDSKGNAYAAGSVFGVGYPVTSGAFQVTWAGGYVFPARYGYGIDGFGIDVGITKYSADGTSRLYCTYLGGDGDELPHSMVVNSQDELIVFGTTASNNFPVTSAAYDTSFGGGPDPGQFAGLGVEYATGCDIFITHFTQDGSAIIGSTYIGGSDNDGVNYPEYQGLHYQYADEVRGTVDVDAGDNIYIASCTRSADFPVTPGAYQTSFTGTMDGVVFKMDNALTTLVWSTFIGGDKMTDCYSLALDKSDNVFVCGGTLSDTFHTTPGAFQTVTHGDSAEGFIALLDQTGSTVLHSTLYGTPSYDQVFFIQLDHLQNVYVLGETEDTSTFFSYNSAYNIPKSGQYISKFSYDLDTLIWSTRFGTGAGRPDISPTAFLVDVCNSIYVAGWGSDFHDLYQLGPVMSTTGLYVTSDAFQPTTDGNDFYVMVMKDDASAISYATYFGSPTDEEHVDGGTSRFDKKGVIYQSVCAGCANSQTNFLPDQNLPTAPANVVSHTNNSPNCNNAIFKLDLNLPLVLADFAVPPSICDTLRYQFVSNSRILDTASTVLYWSFGDGTTSSLTNPLHTFPSSGIYTITLIVSDLSSCNGSDTVRKSIFIQVNDSTITLPAVMACAGNKVQIGVSHITDSTATYQWIPTTGLSSTSVTNPYVTPVGTIDYELLVTTGHCTSIFKQEVGTYADSLILTGDRVLCPYDTIQLFATDTAHLPLTYSWSPTADILGSATVDSPFVLPPGSTVFSVIARNPVTGCIYKGSLNVTVVSAVQNVLVTATPDTIKYGDTTQLNTIYTQYTSLNWDADSSLFSTAIPDPQADPRAPTTYYVNVIDSNGCKVRKSVTVYIKYTTCASSNIFVPNAFSPNNDGKNDKLFVRGNFIENLYFAVYDRWGQKVFETRDQGTGWDGTYNGKKLDPAVYGWYVEGTCAEGQKFDRKGNVTLLK